MTPFEARWKFLKRRRERIRERPDYERVEFAYRATCGRPDLAAGRCIGHLGWVQITESTDYGFHSRLQHPHGLRKDGERYIVIPPRREGGRPVGRKQGRRPRREALRGGMLTELEPLAVLGRDPELPATVECPVCHRDNVVDVRQRPDHATPPVIMPVERRP